jgi:2',3'-cyclic-nucleotide 2'-phosphodiesterase / 3'-nucleotidase
MKPTTLIVFISLILLFAGCHQPEKEIKIKVVTITDLHAAVFPHDFIKDTLHEGGLAHVKSYLDELREQGEKHIILLDNGDLLQGQPTGYYFNFLSARSRNFFSDAMDYLSFDAASVGNHDIETGPEVYNRLKKEFSFPLLAANAIDIQTGEPFFEPYTIVKRGRVKIAVLGLITPSVPNWLPKKLWEGIEFEDMMVSAQKWVDYIRENEQPDAIIGLFHSGAGDETAGVMAENAALKVGKNVPGINIIFTGHDHRERNETFENIAGEQVIMIAAQSHGRAVAAVDLVFQVNDQRKYELVSKEGQLVSMSSYKPNNEFMAKFGEEYRQVAEYVSKSTGQLGLELSSREAYKGSAPFVDFIHDIQLELTGAQISMAAPLSYDAVLKAGNITMRDMFRLYPFENYLYVMQLRGHEIKGALEHSYGLWFTTFRQPGDHVLNFRRGENGEVEIDRNGRARFAGPFYNFDSAVGIDYEVDVRKPIGERINIRQLSSGEAFNMNTLYRVAVNSYRGSGGGGHLTQGAGLSGEQLAQRVVWVSQKDLRSHIADYIKEKGELNPQPFNNWQVIPEYRTRQAIERDVRLLFAE